MKRLPDDVVEYDRTETFDHESIPAPFLENIHTTKPDVWCRVCVVEGTLGYRILRAEPEEHLLDPATPGIVEPETPHTFELRGPVRFRVEFLRRPA